MKRKPTKKPSLAISSAASTPIQYEWWLLTPPRDGLVMFTEDIARALVDREARGADLSESATRFVERVLDIVRL
jgi:hypothetical protein